MLGTSLTEIHWFSGGLLCCLTGQGHLMFIMNFEDSEEQYSINLSSHIRFPPSIFTHESTFRGFRIPLKFFSSFRHTLWLLLGTGIYEMDCSEHCLFSPEYWRFLKGQPYRNLIASYRKSIQRPDARSWSRIEFSSPQLTHDSEAPKEVVIILRNALVDLLKNCDGACLRFFVREIFRIADELRSSESLYHLFLETAPLDESRKKISTEVVLQVLISMIHSRKLMRLSINWVIWLLDQQGPDSWIEELTPAFFHEDSLVQYCCNHNLFDLMIVGVSFNVSFLHYTYERLRLNPSLSIRERSVLACRLLDRLVESEEAHKSSNLDRTYHGFIESVCQAISAITLSKEDVWFFAKDHLSRFILLLEKLMRSPCIEDVDDVEYYPKLLMALWTWLLKDSFFVQHVDVLLRVLLVTPPKIIESLGRHSICKTFVRQLIDENGWKSATDMSLLEDSMVLLLHDRILNPHHLPEELFLDQKKFKKLACEANFIMHRESQAVRAILVKEEKDTPDRVSESSSQLTFLCSLWQHYHGPEKIPYSILQEHMDHILTCGPTALISLMTILGEDDLFTFMESMRHSSGLCNSGRYFTIIESFLLKRMTSYPNDSPSIIASLDDAMSDYVLREEVIEYLVKHRPDLEPLVLDFVLSQIDDKTSSLLSELKARFLQSQNTYAIFRVNMMLGLYIDALKNISVILESCLDDYFMTNENARTSVNLIRRWLWDIVQSLKQAHHHISEKDLLKATWLLTIDTLMKYQEMKNEKPYTYNDEEQNNELQHTFRDLLSEAQSAIISLFSFEYYWTFYARKRANVLSFRDIKRYIEAYYGPRDVEVSLWNSCLDLYNEEMANTLWRLFQKIQIGLLLEQGCLVCSRLRQGEEHWIILPCFHTVHAQCVSRGQCPRCLGPTLS